MEFETFERCVFVLPLDFQRRAVEEDLHLGFDLRDLKSTSPSTHAADCICTSIIERRKTDAEQSFGNTQAKKELVLQCGIINETPRHVTPGYANATLTPCTQASMIIINAGLTARSEPEPPNLQSRPSPP